MLTVKRVAVMYLWYHGSKFKLIDLFLNPCLLVLHLLIVTVHLFSVLLKGQSLGPGQSHGKRAGTAEQNPRAVGIILLIIFSDKISVCLIFLPIYLHFFLIVLHCRC